MTAKSPHDLNLKYREVMNEIGRDFGIDPVELLAENRKAYAAGDWDTYWKCRGKITMLANVLMVYTGCRAETAKGHVIRWMTEAYNGRQG